MMCLYYSKGGCKHGSNCRYAHVENAVLEGTREDGKSWDNASRRAVRDAGFHGICYDFHLKGTCRMEGGYCRFSHDPLGEEKRRQLRHLVHVAELGKFAMDRGLDLPDPDSFKPPGAGRTESSSSYSLPLTSIATKEGEKDTPLDGAKKLEADVQEDSVAGSSTVSTLDPMSR